MTLELTSWFRSAPASHPWPWSARLLKRNSLCLKCSKTKFKLHFSPGLLVQLQPVIDAHRYTRKNGFFQCQRFGRIDVKVSGKRIQFLRILQADLFLLRVLPIWWGSLKGDPHWPNLLENLNSCEISLSILLYTFMSSYICCLKVNSGVLIL